MYGFTEDVAARIRAEIAQDACKARNLHYKRLFKAAMKRLILILAASVLALAGWAQGAEMFSLERVYEVPGVNKYRLYERATAWTVWAWNQYHTRDDYDSDPMGQSMDLVFMNIPAGSVYRNVEIHSGSPSFPGSRCT